MPRPQAARTAPSSREALMHPILLAEAGGTALWAVLLGEGGRAMRAVHWRAWAATTMEYLSLALTVVVTVLAWVAASIWPSLASPTFFVIAALAGLALGLAISLVYLRRALRRRYLCGG